MCHLDWSKWWSWKKNDWSLLYLISTFPSQFKRQMKTVSLVDAEILDRDVNWDELGSPFWACVGSNRCSNPFVWSHQSSFSPGLSLYSFSRPTQDPSLIMFVGYVWTLCKNSIIMVFVSAFVLHIDILVIIFAILTFFAYTWYSLSCACPSSLYGLLSLRSLSLFKAHNSLFNLASCTDIPYARALVSKVFKSAVWRQEERSPLPFHRKPSLSQLAGFCEPTHPVLDFLSQLIRAPIRAVSLQCSLYGISLLPYYVGCVNMLGRREELM